MKKKTIKQIYGIIVFLIALLGGYVVLEPSLQNIPEDKYEVKTMAAGMLEADYQKAWCTPDFGKTEHILFDRTRVDCLTKDYALEFDFAKKWAESVGQSLYYAKMTDRQPGVVLILSEASDMKYVKRIEALENGIKIFLIKAF